MTFNKTQFVIKKRKLMKQNNVLGFDIIKLESHLKQRQRIEIAYCCFFLIFLLFLCIFCIIQYILQIQQSRLSSSLYRGLDVDKNSRLTFLVSKISSIRGVIFCKMVTLNSLNGPISILPKKRYLVKILY